MWIKTHSGRLVNTDRVNTLGICESYSPPGKPQRVYVEAVFSDTEEDAKDSAVLTQLLPPADARRILAHIEEELAKGTTRLLDLAGLEYCKTAEEVECSLPAEPCTKPDAECCGSLAKEMPF